MVSEEVQGSAEVWGSVSLGSWVPPCVAYGAVRS